jgi:hypothetical protein
MKIRKCDFCGKELPLINKNLFSFELFESNYSLELKEQRIDACRDCFHKLLEFIKKNKRC